MISVRTISRTISNILLTYVWVLIIFILILNILGFYYTIQIDDYNTDAENATFNTIFTEINYLETHLNRIDDSQVIIDAHLDFVDSHQDNHSMAFKIYNRTKQKRLSKITNITNQNLINLAHAASNSTKKFNDLGEQKRQKKNQVFWIMIILFLITTVLLYLQFYQNKTVMQKEAAQQKEVPSTDNDLDKENSKNYDDISYQVVGEDY